MGNDEISVELVDGTSDNGIFAPRNEKALYACYIAKSSKLSSTDIKALQLLGHSVKILKERS